MTLEEAKDILFKNRRSTCSCKYNSVSEMLGEALKLKLEQEKKELEESTKDVTPPNEGTTY